MARPFVKLPQGAKYHLEALAAEGLLSESRAAETLRMPLDEFRRVIREHEQSRRTWDNALSIERDALLTALYDRAVGGDTKAARTLLAARHGIGPEMVAAS